MESLSRKFVVCFSFKVSAFLFVSGKFEDGYRSKIKFSEKVRCVGASSFSEKFLPLKQSAANVITVTGVRLLREVVRSGGLPRAEFRL